MVLLSSKCDSPEGMLTLSSTKQRCVKGRVTGECQPSPLASMLSKGAARCQQDTGPVVLQNWPAGSWPLAPWPALHLHPVWDATHHKAPCPTLHWVSDGCRQFLQLCFSLARTGSCGPWGHFRNMSFPCLLTVVGGIRTSQKQIGKTKFPIWIEEQKRWNMKACTTEVRDKFPWESMRPVFLQQDWKVERDRSLNMFKKKLAFCFLSCTAN